MHPAARAFLKRALPPRAKAAIWKMREMVEKPPIDDVVLARYRLEADDAQASRLNLVIPNLAASSAFGGVMTGLDVFLSLAKRLRMDRSLDLRVIFTEPDRETESAIFRKAAARLGIDVADATFVEVHNPTQAIAVRRNDLFVSYNWWTTLNTQHLIDEQAAHYGGRVRPLIYLIQEYEPHLMAFSSSHMLAREAYDTPARLWGIFNSSNLYNYYLLEGHGAERSFVFEPLVNDKLRPYLDEVGSTERAKRILVYGRPGVPRNCFPALVRGLRRWVETDPAAMDWDLVSAGTAHNPIDLGKGKSLSSVGKLSLDDYAGTLLTSSVGVSLMASPHPSYPPLEMAHMGMRTITNAYLGKDLATYHPNIVSIASITEDALAGALQATCARFGETTSSLRVPDYVRTDDYPFMEELIGAIGEELAEG